MSKTCPVTKAEALYLDCQECAWGKACEKRPARVCVGVDQSYKRTGVSVAVNNRLVKCRSIDLSGFQTKAEKRTAVRGFVSSCLDACLAKYDDVTVVLERTRTFSQRFLSVPYIKSMGALNAVVADEAFFHGLECYSIDTRAWKSGVVGTCKPATHDRWGMDPKKLPTAEWLSREDPRRFKRAVIELPEKSRRAKGTFIDEKTGKRLEINDDLCDSAAIALSWFRCDPDKFQRED